MKRTLISTLAIGLAASCAPALAQMLNDPPPLLRIFREEIKQGHQAAHEKVETAYVRAFSKTKYPPYIALETLTGPSEAWFLECHASYASIENAIQLSEAPPLKAELALLDAQDGEQRSGSRGLIARFQKALSYRSSERARNMAKDRYVFVQIIRVRYGHSPEYGEALGMLNAALEKTKKLEYDRVVYRISSGGPDDDTYLIFNPTPSLKIMDPPTPMALLPQAMGQETLAKFRKTMNDVILNHETLLFSINPRMSSPPKEFVEADRDFWAPKP
jgi:hypothetical protein